MICERCWADAYSPDGSPNGSQYDNYLHILKERKNHPCTPKQQAGQWWDEEKQRDTRIENTDEN